MEKDNLCVNNSSENEKNKHELIKLMGDVAASAFTCNGIVLATEENFDKDGYLEFNKDVAASGMDALQHFNTYGKEEKRLQYCKQRYIKRL